MSELIPRLSSTQMSPDLADYLRPRVERLGYLGEFFQCSAHQPGALLAFMRFTEELTQSEIAARMGVSQMQISRLLRRSLERLRELAG